MDEEKEAGTSFKRPMVQGKWQCSDCGTAITELPFEPSEGQSVYCSECYRNKRPRSSRGPRKAFDRPMVQGNWQCSGCGKTITELPFEPGEGRPIYCRDCFRDKRPRGSQRNF